MRGEAINTHLSGTSFGGIISFLANRRIPVTRLARTFIIIIVLLIVGIFAGFFFDSLSVRVAGGQEGVLDTVVVDVSSVTSVEVYLKEGGIIEVQMGLQERAMRSDQCKWQMRHAQSLLIGKYLTPGRAQPAVFCSIPDFSTWYEPQKAKMAYDLCHFTGKELAFIDGNRITCGGATI